MAPGEGAQRPRWARQARRLGLLIAVSLIIGAIIILNSIAVSSNGKAEWLNGHADTTSLLLPLLMFLAGMVGLALCLPDRRS